MGYDAELSAVAGAGEVSPFEDFTTLTVMDNAPPDDRLAITKNKIAVSGLTRAEDVFGYWDFGVGHFSGDYEFRTKVNVASADYNLGYVAIMTLANTIGVSIFDVFNQADWNLCYVSPLSGAISIFIGDKTSITNCGVLSLDTDLFVKIRRDESVGVFGTMYVDVYSDDSFAAPALIASASQALAVAKYDLRYLYPVSGSNLPQARIVSCDIENFEIISP